MKHFKNPVSMRVTQEQFERDLKKPLEELGAKFKNIEYFINYPILVSNMLGCDGFFENIKENYKSKHNRHFIETYDPEQFIAICKLEVEMIVGECYTIEISDMGKCIGYLLENNYENKGFKLKGLFKRIGLLNDYLEKSEICYTGTDRTIRLSTPKEKAKLDKVIAEQTEVNDELIISNSELKPKPIKVIDKVKSDLKQANKKVKLLKEVLKYLENE